MIKPAFFHMREGRLEGEGVTRSSRSIGDLGGVFLQEKSRLEMDQNLKVYEVEMHDRCGAVEGGLYFGISHVHAGKVGDEYFMTKGHYHAIRDRGEYYWGLQGEGLLLLMDERRKAWTEKVHTGSLHYIPGRVAHRLVNIGGQTLVVGACWPADAGHDYEAIQREGFGLRVFEKDGNPVVIGVEEGQ